MGLNWNAFAEQALTGVGNVMTWNYQKAQEEQRQIAEESRRYQTDMNKAKELERMRGASAQAERDRQLEQWRRMNPGQPDSEGIRAIEGFDYTVDQKQDQAVTLMEKQAEAEETIQERRIKDALDKSQYAPGSPEYKKLEAKLRGTDISDPNTAAQTNAAEVDKILSKYKDGDLSKVSDADQVRLAVYGVTLPGAKKDLTDAVKASVWKESVKSAQDMYSEDKMADNDAINAANKLLEPTGRKVESADAARKLLIDNESLGGYVMGVSVITGQFPGNTPAGQSIPDEQAEAIVTSRMETDGMPEVETAPGKKPQGALAGDIPYGSGTVDLNISPDELRKRQQEEQAKGQGKTKLQALQERLDKAKITQGQRQAYELTPQQ